MRYRESKKEKSSEKKSKKGITGGGLSPEGEIIQKSPGNYGSRYTGLVAPESKIVEEIKPSYESRY